MNKISKEILEAALPQTQSEFGAGYDWRVKMVGRTHNVIVSFGLVLRGQIRPNNYAEGVARHFGLSVWGLLLRDDKNTELVEYTPNLHKLRLNQDEEMLRLHIYLKRIR